MKIKKRLPDTYLVILSHSLGKTHPCAFNDYAISLKSSVSTSCFEGILDSHETPVWHNTTAIPIEIIFGCHIVLRNVESR